MIFGDKIRQRSTVLVREEGKESVKIVPLLMETKKQGCSSAGDSKPWGSIGDDTSGQ